jgi:hypothetical protein
MNFLLQRFWHTNVIREQEHLVTAKTTYLDNWMERVAVLKARVDSLEIEEAWLERLGRRGGIPESREYLKSLNGVKAYLGSGLKLREALKGVNNEIERSLFNDSVIGIVQAETFLFRERGYNNAREYSRAWEKFYKGSCHYYSNLDKVNNSWGDYTGTMGRRFNLFERCKIQHLSRDDNGLYLLQGSIIDSFHQVNTYLKLDKKMKVISAQGQLLRVPDNLCRRSAVYMDSMIGLSIPGLTKKEVAHRLGAGQGCVHLIDLTFDGVKTLELYILHERTDHLSNIDKG